MNIACMLKDLHEKMFFRHTKWRDISACFNCFNNSFTFRFKRKLSEKSSCFEKTIVSHTKCLISLTFNDLRIVCRSCFRHFRRLHLRLFYVFMIVAFVMNVTHLRTSHRDHVFCRSMKKEEAMNWSLRDEIEREREIMWRACIAFNIWQS